MRLTNVKILKEKQNDNVNASEAVKQCYCGIAKLDPKQNSGRIDFLLDTSSHAMGLISPVTNLPNRRACDHFLKSACSHVENAETTCYYYIAFVDLKGFKSVNDNLGYNTGDCLLEAFGEWAASELLSVSASGIEIFLEFYHYGGDEFVILAYNGALDQPCLFSKTNKRDEIPRDERIKKTTNTINLRKVPFNNLPFFYTINEFKEDLEVFGNFSGLAGPNNAHTTTKQYDTTVHYAIKGLDFRFGVEKNFKAAEEVYLKNKKDANSDANARGSLSVEFYWGNSDDLKIFKHFYDDLVLRELLTDAAKLEEKLEKWIDSRNVEDDKIFKQFYDDPTLRELLTDAAKLKKIFGNWIDLSNNIVFILKDRANSNVLSCDNQCDKACGKPCDEVYAKAINATNAYAKTLSQAKTKQIISTGEETAEKEAAAKEVAAAIDACSNICAHAYAKLCVKFIEVCYSHMLQSFGITGETVIVEKVRRDNAYLIRVELNFEKIKKSIFHNSNCNTAYRSDTNLDFIKAVESSAEVPARNYIQKKLFDMCRVACGNLFFLNHSSKS